MTSVGLKPLGQLDHLSRHRLIAGHSVGTLGIKQGGAVLGGGQVAEHGFRPGIEIVHQVRQVRHLGGKLLAASQGSIALGCGQRQAVLDNGKLLGEVAFQGSRPIQGGGQLPGLFGHGQDLLHSLIASPSLPGPWRP